MTEIGLLLQGAAVVVSIFAVVKIHSLHIMINSNLARQIQSAVSEAHQLGIAQGIEAERQRVESKEIQ